VPANSGANEGLGKGLNGMRKRLFNKDERGISAVIVAVSLLGVFGAAMLSLDAGNMWQTRRNIITVTDATALGQAKYLAFAADPSQCEPMWTDFMLNLDGAGAAVTPINCDPEAASNGTGYVVVEGSKTARTRFGGLFGIGNTEPYSLSAAQWGFASSGRGLRPPSFCNKNHHVEEWLALKNPGQSWGTLTQQQYNALPDTEPTEVDAQLGNTRIAHSRSAEGKVLHRMYFNKSLEDGACGDFAGNWGWLGFTGTPNQTQVLNGRIEDGWNDGAVTIRESDDPACVAEPGGGDAADSAEGCVPGDPGAIAQSNASALDEILDVPVTLMIFDTGVCSGGGSNCKLEAWAFLGVILRDYQATGQEHLRYLEFEFTDIALSGSCCTAGPPNGVDTGVRGVKICEVDHDFQAGSTILSRCAPTA